MGGKCCSSAQQRDVQDTRRIRQNKDIKGKSSSKKAHECEIANDPAKPGPLGFYTEFTIERRSGSQSNSIVNQSQRASKVRNSRRATQKETQKIDVVVTKDGNPIERQSKENRKNKEMSETGHKC